MKFSFFVVFKITVGMKKEIELEIATKFAYKI